MGPTVQAIIKHERDGYRVVMIQTLGTFSRLLVSLTHRRAMKETAIELS